MSEDKIDKIFGSLDDFYPGSKKKRRPVSSEVERKKQEKQERAEWALNPQVKTLPNGNVVELYSAGTLALALGRPLVTVRLWERKGYIPKAPYRLRSMIVNGEKKPGWRMYSRDMIESILTSFQSRGLEEAPRIDWNRFPDLSLEIYDNWKQIHSQETE